MLGAKCFIYIMNIKRKRKKLMIKSRFIYEWNDIWLILFFKGNWSNMNERVSVLT